MVDHLGRPKVINPKRLIYNLLRNVCVQCERNILPDFRNLLQKPDANRRPEYRTDIRGSATTPASTSLRGGKDKSFINLGKYNKYENKLKVHRTMTFTTLMLVLIFEPN